jgi:nucleotide-binding universal stress UspA family protein
MKLLEKILVAVGRDDVRRQVVLAVAHLARRFGSQVVLVHVREPIDGFSDEPGTPAERDEPWLDELRAALDASGVDLRHVLCPHGRAFFEIITLAEDLHANLIVLGARGTLSPQPLVVGTTAEKVMRKAGKPVLVVNPERAFECRKILCAVDFSAAATRPSKSSPQRTRPKPI